MDGVSGVGGAGREAGASRREGGGAGLPPGAGPPRSHSAPVSRAAGAALGAVGRVGRCRRPRLYANEGAASMQMRRPHLCTNTGGPASMQMRRTRLCTNTGGRACCLNYSDRHCRGRAAPRAGGAERLGARPPPGSGRHRFGPGSGIGLAERAAGPRRGPAGGRGDPAERAPGSWGPGTAPRGRRARLERAGGAAASNPGKVFQSKGLGQLAGHLEK